MCMCRIFISGLSGFTAFFPHCPTNGRILEKNKLNIRGVFWFSLQLLSEIFLTLRRTELDMIIDVYWFAWKLVIISVRFYETWIFLTHYRKILKYQLSWKFVHWEPRCSMRTEQTSRSYKYSWFQTFALIWILYIFCRGIKYLASSHTSHCTPSLWRWNWYRVPKRRPTTFWRRGNTQKKIYNSYK